MNIRSSSYLAVLSCFIAVTTIMACKPADTLLHKNQANEEWRDITDSGLPRIEAANLSSLSQAGRLGPVEAAEETDSEFTMKSISGSVAIDKAKLAAAKQDKCPKLVNSPIDSTQIVRKNEVMRDTYCDYYIYPKKGQRISIGSHPKQIAANLISPVYYDFANGSYLVNQADKYVIRLSYEGVEYMSSPIDYDVTINVQ